MHILSRTIPTSANQLINLIYLFKKILTHLPFYSDEPYICDKCRPPSGKSFPVYLLALLRHCMRLLLWNPSTKSRCPLSGIPTPDIQNAQKSCLKLFRQPDICSLHHFESGNTVVQARVGAEQRILRFAGNPHCRHIGG